MAVRASWLAAVVVAGGLTLTACGSSDESDESGAATAAAAVSDSGDNGLERAQAAVDAASQAPQPIDRPALSAPAPKGKQLVYVSCPVQTCTVVEAGLKAGVKALGWSMKTVQGGIDPQAQNKGWSAAVELKPDAIIGITTVPFAAIKEPLEEAKAAEIPVVTIAGDGDPADNIISTLVSPKAQAPTGTLMADWVATDSKGKANVVLFNDPSNASFNATAAAFEAELSKVCPSCASQVEKYSTVDIGKTVPGQVVSYLQKNPDTTHVGFTLGSGLLGVPEALQAAGLGEEFKLFARAATPPNQVNIDKGAEAMGIGEELTSLGWESLDAVARSFVGDEISKDIAQPEIKFQLLTKENIDTAVKPDPSGVWELEGVPEQFMKLWGVGA